MFIVQCMAMPALRCVTSGGRPLPDPPTDSPLRSNSAQLYTSKPWSLAIYFIERRMPNSHIKHTKTITWLTNCFKQIRCYVCPLPAITLTIWLVILLLIMFILPTLITLHVTNYNTASAAQKNNDTTQITS